MQCLFDSQNWKVGEGEGMYLARISTSACKITIFWFVLNKLSHDCTVEIRKCEFKSRFCCSLHYESIRLKYKTKGYYYLLVNHSSCP